MVSHLFIFNCAGKFPICRSQFFSVQPPTRWNLLDIFITSYKLLPFRELTYPITKSHFESMIFQTSLLVGYVIYFPGNLSPVIIMFYSQNMPKPPGIYVQGGPQNRSLHTWRDHEGLCLGLRLTPQSVSAHRKSSEALLLWLVGGVSFCFVKKKQGNFPVKKGKTTWFNMGCLDMGGVSTK